MQDVNIGYRAHRALVGQLEEWCWDPLSHQSDVELEGGL